MFIFRSDACHDAMNIVPPILSPRSQSTVAPPPVPPKAVPNNITASVESIASQDTPERSDSGMYFVTFLNVLHCWSLCL